MWSESLYRSKSSSQALASPATHRLISFCSARGLDDNGSRRSFDSDKLVGNLQALLDALNKAKPASSKGIYLRKVAVSSTMGVGVRVDASSIAQQAQA